MVDAISEYGHVEPLYPSYHQPGDERNIQTKEPRKRKKKKALSFDAHLNGVYELLYLFLEELQNSQGLKQNS